MNRKYIFASVIAALFAISIGIASNASASHEVTEENILTKVRQHEGALNTQHGWIGPIHKSLSDHIRYQESPRVYEVTNSGLEISPGSVETVEIRCDEPGHLMLSVERMQFTQSSNGSVPHPDVLPSTVVEEDGTMGYDFHVTNRSTDTNILSGAHAFCLDPVFPDQ